MLYKATELTRTFKGRQVLRLKQLSIEKEKIYALIGANGAGKTTLLNVLAFLDKPTTGQLHFHGQPVRWSRQHLLELRRRVVLVDQYPILFTGSVLKNVEFGLKVRGISKEIRRKRTLKTLQLVGMEKFIHADAHKLSGGESKRVALARALVIEPEVLLCDEPTANVDAENQEIILKILQTINTEHKTSILLATHYLSQSRSLAHHTLVLEHGTFSSTKNENIFRCQGISRDKDCIICKLNSQVSLHLATTFFQGMEKQCSIHLDPAKLQLLPQSQKAEEPNTISGQITKIEKDKQHIRVTVNCQIKLHLLLSREEYLHLKPVIGEQRAISIPENSIQFSPIAE